MKQIDITYQAAVDIETDKVFKLAVDDFLKIDDYGTIETTIDTKKITIGFWHYKYNDNLHHVIFKTSRRCYLILHKPYLNGVKLENGKILKLTDKEIGDHD